MNAFAYGTAVLACALAACSSGTTTTTTGGGSSGALDPMGKFTSLGDLLSNPSVQSAIAKLPSGTGVAPGAYYQGSTPADISGKWSTACCGGSTGVWTDTSLFGGQITFQVTSPGNVDVPAEMGDSDMENGAGSFIVGEGDHVTAFLQLAITCLANGEHVRAVTVDRFVHSPSALSEYVRSYVVLARDNPTSADWTCFTDAVGTGEIATSAVFGNMGSLTDAGADGAVSTLGAADAGTAD
jgi:hypothetical protein